MLHLLHTPNLHNFFFDFINYAFIVFGFYYFFKKKIIDRQLFFCLIVCSSTPFLINNYLFYWGFMPDQAKYFGQAHALRNFEFDKIDKLTTVVPSIIYAIFPIPFIETINSIGFINKCILGLTTIYLYHKKVINNLFFILINFWPSVLLYSSVSLKDTLILCLLLLFAFYQNKNEHLKSLIIITFLFSIKFLYSFLLFIILIYKNIYKDKKLNYYKFISLVLLIICSLYFSDDLEYIINDLRYGFFSETYSPNYKFNEIVIDLNFPLQILNELTRFLFSPYPNIYSFAHLLQVIENLLFYSIIIFLLNKLYLIDKSKFIFWSSSLIFTLSSLSVLIFSSGTIARYKYTILFYFIFGIYLEIKNYDKKFKIL